MPLLRAISPKSRPLSTPNRRHSPLAKAATLLASLALLGALLYIFFGNRTDWKGPQPEGPATLLRAELKRDFQNAILTLEIRFQNDTRHRINPAPPFTELLDAENQLVALFTLGSLSDDAPIPPGEVRTFRIPFWLEPGQLTGPLHLKIDTEKIMVKSPAHFDLEKIPNQQSIPLHSPDW